MALPINIPARITQKMPITAAWANDIREAIVRLARVSQSSSRGVYFKHREPFDVVIQCEGSSAWSIFIKTGKVVARDNKTGNCVSILTVTDLPTKEAPLTVIDGDKIWVEVTESVEGIATAATLVSGSSWPDSLAPVLKGGDDQTGAAGSRIYKIASIAAHPDDSAYLVCTQELIGHIDHFQPTLSENTIATASSGEARVLKEWNATYGRWDFRYLEAGTGVTLTEDDDKITIDAAGGGEDHPWKVTANATANQWDVVLGTVYGHGVEITPTIASPFTFTPASTGFIYLKITRDATTRVPSAAVVLAAATVPTSDEEFQYRTLAYVTSAPSVIQLQFEEMRILEIAIVENGAYKLAPLELSSRNTYALPT